MKKLILFLSLCLFLVSSLALGQGSDLRIRNLYVYRGIDGRGGVPLWWDGFIYGQYSGTARDCVFYNYTGSGQYLMRLQGDGANVFTIDKSGNVVVGGTLVAAGISGAASLPDLDASHSLNLVWNEDDVANRTLNFLVSGGNRSLTLQNDLTVEAASLINQDLTSDSIVATFGGLSLFDGNITNVGDISLDSISSDSGTTINIDLGSDAGDDFTVDTNKLVVEGDTGNIGINTVAPLGRVDIVGVNPAVTISTGLKNLLIQQESAITSSYTYNLLSEFDIDAPTNSSGLYFGGHFELGTVTGNSVNYTGDLVALQGQSEHFGSGDVSKTIGVFGASVNRSTGTIAEARAGVFRILDYSTGTITNAHTVYVDNYDGSGTVVGKTGIMIADITGANNNTELLIGTPTIPTGDFSIYNASTADSYFVGSLGMNTTGPDRRLDILDASSPQLRLTHTDGTIYNDLQVDSSGRLSIVSNVGDLLKIDSDYNTTLGEDAGTNLTATESVWNMLFGYRAGTNISTGDGNVCIGYRAGDVIAAGLSNMAIGDRALYSLTNSSYNVGVGSGAGYNHNTHSGVFIGTNAGYHNTGGAGSIYIGRDCGPASGDGAHAGSIGIGYSVRVNASNQLVLGSQVDLGIITQAYLGQGVARVDPEGITVQATGGSGTDNAGGSLTLAGGKGTGNALGGSLILSTSDAGASGDTLQSLSEKARMIASGNFGINTTGPDRKLDVLDASNPQLRLTHTNEVDYAELQADTNGDLTIVVSGDEVKIPEEIVFTPSGAQVIDAVGDTILADATIIELNPDGDYVMTSTPTIADGTKGQIIYVMCDNAEANTVTVQDQDTLGGSNLQLGVVSRAISGKDVLCLLFDGTDWLEVSFADN